VRVGRGGHLANDGVGFAAPRAGGRMSTAAAAVRTRAPAAEHGNRTVRLLALVVAREVRLTWLLFDKEVRELLVSRALWAMVLISAPLVGFSFIQAVRLYTQSSSNALRLPQLVPNINPLDGIVIPTFGAVYLMNT